MTTERQDLLAALWKAQQERDDAKLETAAVGRLLTKTDRDYAELKAENRALQTQLDLMAAELDRLRLREQLR